MELLIQPRKNFKLTEEIKTWAQNKFDKFDKFFQNDAKAVLSLYEEKNDISRAEGVIITAGLTFRAENTHADPLVAIDNVEKLITRQFSKYKSKLVKSLKNDAPLPSYPKDEPVVEEKEFNIVRSKQLDLKPMSAEEAILQMNLLGHEFFLFKNDKTLRSNLVYKRKDGNYALIEEI